MAIVALVVATCGGVSEPAATRSAPTTTTGPVTTLGTTTSAAATTTTPSTTVAQLVPMDGGTVVIGDDQVPPTLNPYAPGGDNFVVGLIAQALHTGVWDVDASLQLVPEIVIELPSIANGGLALNADGSLTVRYQIRDEAVWADGTPISGDDFAFTYEQLASPELEGTQFGAFDDYALIDPESVEAGAKTFAYTMPVPSLAYEGLFRWLFPRHQVEGTDILSDWDQRPWLSGGPFELDSWEQGTSDLGSSVATIRLVRNDKYWKVDAETGAPLPHLDEVVFEFMPETESIIAAFAARELDVINPPPWIEGIERLTTLTDEGAVVEAGSGIVWEHFNFQFGPLNRNGDSFNQHLAFRRAVAHALDRDAIVADLLSGYGHTLSSYIDAFTPALSGRAWDRYDYDPDEARRLIAGLCEELGRDCESDPPTLVFSTTSNSDARPRIANHVAEMLSAVGIEVELQLEDSQLYFGETLSRGTWDLGLWAWVGSPGLRGLIDIHDVFDPELPPPDGSNYYRWGTPATDGTYDPPGGTQSPIDVTQGPSLVRNEHTDRLAEIVDAMHATVDESEVLSLVAEAESILADQVVIIPLYSRLVVTAHWGDEIDGPAPNPSQAGYTWNIEEWRRLG